VPVALVQVVEDFARAHPEWQDALSVERRASVDALCDRMLVRRVLANLVENAIQAAESAGKKPLVRIGVDLDPTRQAAHLVVDDNGPGVAPEAHERIFDPYFTTKEHGTGLGLAIVRKIVIDHGGDVRVADEPSPLGGARLVVTLPAAPAARGSAPRDAVRDDRHRQR
jgi:signal transduction histidine kinase